MTAVLLRVIYLAVNVVYLGVSVTDLSYAGRRVGTLLVINLGLLLSGLYLNFLAHLLGLLVGALWAAYCIVSIVAFGLAVFHVIMAAVIERALLWRELKKPLVVIVRSSFPVAFLATNFPRRVWHYVYLWSPHDA